MKVVSLFSGVGGLDLGFVKSGFEIVFANDILLDSVLTYSRNIGLKIERCGEKTCSAKSGTVVLGSVENIDFSDLTNVDVDVVIGGPPCQDFSVLRGNKIHTGGIETRRGRLYVHFVRALVQLEPKVFVFENVPGLISANYGAAYRTILNDLRNLNMKWDDIRKTINMDEVKGKPHGYMILFSKVVDFSFLGVPQRRRRLIIIGVRKDLVRNTRDLMMMTTICRTLEGQSSIFKKYPLTPIEVFEGDVLPNLNDKYREIMMEWNGLWEELRTDQVIRWKKHIWDNMTFDVVKDYLLVNEIDNWNIEELENVWVHHRKVLDELGYMGNRVCSKPPLDVTCVKPTNDYVTIRRLMLIPPGENIEFLKGTELYTRGIDISIRYRRLHPLKPAYTVIAHGGGDTQGYHYERKRGTLTLREKARLQTFPDDFIFIGNMNDVRSQIGEAVPPLAGKRITELIKKISSFIS